MRFCRSKTPSEVVLVELSTLVWRLIVFTKTFGTIAPEASVTRPVIRPVAYCACNEEAASKAMRLRRFIPLSSRQILFKPACGNAGNAKRYKRWRYSIPEPGRIQGEGSDLGRRLSGYFGQIPNPSFLTPFWRQDNGDNGPEENQTHEANP